MIWKPWALCSDDIGNYYYIYVKNSLFIRQNLKMSFWEPCQLPQTFQVSSCLWSFLGNPNIHILYPHMLTCPGFQGKNFNQRTLVEFLHDQPCVRSWTHCILPAEVETPSAEHVQVCQRTTQISGCLIYSIKRWKGPSHPKNQNTNNIWKHHFPWQWLVGDLVVVEFGTALLRLLLLDLLASILV